MNHDKRSHQDLLGMQRYHGLPPAPQSPRWKYMKYQYARIPAGASAINYPRAGIRIMLQPAILERIFRKLDLKSLLRCNLACRQFRNAICRGASNTIKHMLWFQPLFTNYDYPYITNPAAVDPLIRKLRDDLDLFYRFDEARRTWHVMCNATVAGRRWVENAKNAYMHASWKLMVVMRHVESDLRWKVGFYRNGNLYEADLGQRPWPPTFGEVMRVVDNLMWRAGAFSSGWRPLK